MRLKKLEIHGFKSFADRVEMTFEDGITGVVGPNGCGKSNISDAMRWVLGEQSAKTLRGGKMEDVIFNGTEKRRKAASCEVTLTFENEDRALPVDYHEVAVTRRVYRSGDSEYLINKTPCRLKDIVELFRDTGIGKEGYSLIGQGRIDEILSAKSEDRRQIFEEAAGIVKFKSRRIEAERRLSHTAMNLERVDDILGELEQRVEPLRNQSETAREYLALRDELKGLELNSFLVRSERYEARIKDMKDTMAALEGALQDAAAEESRLAEQREQTEQQQTDLEARAAVLRESVQQLIADVEASEGAAGVMRERISYSNREIERLTAEIDSAKNGGGALRERRERLTKQIAADQAAIASLEAEVSGKQALLIEKDSLLRSEEARAEEIKASIISAMNRMGNVRSEQARLTAMKTAIEDRLAALEGDRDSEKVDAEGLNTRLAEAEAELKQNQSAQAEMETKLERLKISLQQNDGQRMAVRNETEKTNADKHALESRLKILQEMQRDYEGYQNSVKQVLLYADRARVAGVRGVVASLIRVPAKLERAIDMVLGAALQNVVVDRDEDAKQMIEYLRRNRYGRATFLPISSIRSRTMTPQDRHILDLPGCVGVASELIEFDEEYRGVMESLLGRTIIAENLDAGIKIQRAGRYQYRLVTLEGDVMHAGGSMTGGSVQSRVTSLLSREREIKENRAQLAEADKRLAQLQKRAAEVEQARRELHERQAQLVESIHSQEIECARSEAHMNAAREELNKVRQRDARFDQEQEQLTTQLSDVLEGLQAVSAQLTDSESDTKGDQQKVREIQLGISELRHVVDALRDDVNNLSVNLAAKKRGVEADEQESRRLERQLQDLSGSAETMAAELTQLQAQLEIDAKQLKTDEATLETGKAQLEQQRAQFNKADGERMRAQQHLSKLHETIGEVRARIDEMSDKSHRAEVQLSRVETEFTSMTQRIWEDYELTYEGAKAFAVEGFKLSDSERRIAVIRARIKEMGAVNVAAVDEYRETVQRVEEMSTQRDDLLRAQGDLEKLIDDLNKKMDVQFKSQFALLNENFKKTFVSLFGGGTAELKLADEKDALNCGIDIIAQPPGKKLQMLSLLSGGERALTAIAILFAMLTLKPTPFCFLDEIEAALDDANIDNFADYLKEYSRNTQFVVVTHRKGTMERCDALYGVAMQEKGISRLVSVKLDG